MESLKKNRESLVAKRAGEHPTIGFRRKDLLREFELKSQWIDFLASLIKATPSDATSKVQSPAWAGVREAPCLRAAGPDLCPFMDSIGVPVTKLADLGSYSHE